MHGLALPDSARLTLAACWLETGWGVWHHEFCSGTSKICSTLPLQKGSLGRANQAGGCYLDGHPNELHKGWLVLGWRGGRG